MAKFDIGALADQEARRQAGPVKPFSKFEMASGKDLEGFWDWDAWKQSKGAPLMDRIQAALPKGSQGAEQRERFLFGQGVDLGAPKIDVSEDPALTTADKMAGGEKTTIGQKLGLALAIAAGALGTRNAMARGGKGGNRQAKAVEEIIDGIGKEAKASAKGSKSLYDIYYGAEKGAGEGVEQAGKKAAKDAAEEAAEDLTKKGSKASVGEDVPVNKPKPEVPKSEPNGPITVQGTPMPEVPKGNLGWRFLKQALPWAIGAPVVGWGIEAGLKSGRKIGFEWQRSREGMKPMPADPSDPSPAAQVGFDQSLEKKQAETYAYNMGAAPGSEEWKAHMDEGLKRYYGRVDTERAESVARRKMAEDGLKAIDMELRQSQERSRATDAAMVSKAYDDYNQATQAALVQQMQSFQNWMMDPRR